MIGTKLGSYDVLAKLGEGGMGQVYRARDTRLNRDVAIKVLPDAFANDAERLARFKREAQTLAALSHPNIAAVYGFEESGSTRALIMELVGGEDLSSLVARGPVPLGDAIPIARQIVDALDAAHDKGIVHRDLKPGNVKVAADGSVKVLDFGLAKAVESAGTSADGVATAATVTSPAMTALGMILGTAAYMSPEQARGRAVDRRSDIWAFGVVLYEMLTGGRPFKGDDISEVVATVLKTEPEWTALPADTPVSIRRLLHRCLEKDPRKRLGAISDARFDLDEALAPPPFTGLAPAPVRRGSLLTYVAFAMAGAVVTAGVALATWPHASAAPQSLARTSMVAPPGLELWPDSAQVVISPDGQYVAFVSGNPIDRQAAQLWVRPINSLAAKPLEGTDGASLPFWKPDSSRIGFFAGTKMKSIPVDGGRPDVIADASFGRGGTWNENDVIVFAGDASGIISRVSANGGDVKQLTTLDKSRKEVSHRLPVFLPDGDHFLFASLPGHDGKFDIFAGSLTDPAVTFVGAMGSTPVYAEPGWLLYGRRGVLVAQPFDAKTLKTTGDARPLGDEPTAVLDPSMSYTAGHTTSVSKTGALAYFSGPPASTRLTWLDAIGRPAGTVPIQPGNYEAVKLSRDGTQAVLVRSVSPTESSLVVVDVARGSAVPLSSGGGRNESPVWSPDGTRVLFASDRGGAQDLFVKTLVDAAPETPLYQSSALFKTPSDWSRDGKAIVFFQLDLESAYNLYTVPAAGGTPTVAVRGKNRDVNGHISPDGKWLAYLAEFGESGFQLCAQAFPTPGRSIQLTTGGATQFWWTDDNRQIVYVSGNLLWRVNVQPSGADLRVVGEPTKLGILPPGLARIDAMPDRQKFLALVPERLSVGSITVVQNWMAGLAK
jgi:serine/threonine protein kinase/Tol biopolymer transport system component